MVIYARYMKDGQRHTEFLQLMPLQDGTAADHMSSLSRAMWTRDAVYTTVRPLVSGTLAVIQQLRHNRMRTIQHCRTPLQNFLSSNSTSRYQLKNSQMT